MGIQTLEQFISEQQTQFPQAKGELTRLLQGISLAAKIVHREVNKAGLADILGKQGRATKARCFCRSLFYGCIGKIR